MTGPIRIAHLYPDLLNLYGDRGNLSCLQKRLLWRGIDAAILPCAYGDDIPFQEIDIIFIGGGSDREEAIVCHQLQEQKAEISAFCDDGGVLVAVCGGYQLLGHYYQTAHERIEGLSLLDIYTEAGDTRFIGNVIVDSELCPEPIVGFENHAGRTFIGSHTPLGTVRFGHGNGGEETAGRFEGVVYKNIIGTYLHGPLLPKNPGLCDNILARALSRRGENTVLAPLDDRLEREARNEMIQRIQKMGR